MMKNILIVDDHSIVRLGIKHILKEIDSNITFFEADNKSDAIKALQNKSGFDLFILDVNMPEYSCEQMIELCKLKFANAKIMILTMAHESLLAKRFYQMGIDAFINKSTIDNDLKIAFQRLFENKKYYSNNFLNQIAEESLNNKRSFSDNPLTILSQKEMEVLQHLVEGKALKEISNILSAHQSTISTYKKRIFEKLNVDNLIDLYTIYNLYNS